MREYSIEELQNAATYSADPQLAMLARRVAEAQTGSTLPTGERKRPALAGGMAEAVHEAWRQAMAVEHRAAAEAASQREAVEAIPLPPGWSVRVVGVNADFTGPRDETINASLRRHGTWLAAERVWRVPLAKGATLARSLKRSAGPAATAAREDRAMQTRMAEIERWLGFVEEAARGGRLYQRGIEECQARKIADLPELQTRLDRALVTARALAAQIERERAAARAEREAVASVERVKRAEAASNRMLYPVNHSPATGRPCRLPGLVVVFTGSGQRFRIGDDHPSMWPGLLGHEGEQGAYYYYREATAKEIAALEADEALAAAAHATHAARAAAAAEVVSALCRPECLAPAAALQPAGAVVHGELTPYGGGQILMIGEDGAAWCVRGNGGDGDDWSRNNVPGAIAWRSEDSTLIERLRALAQP